MQVELKPLIESIKNGGIGVLPTDTIFGIVGNPFDENAVKRIGKAKGRPLDKRYIMLISDIEQLKLFDIHLSNNQLRTLNDIWPAPISIILPRGKDSLKYLQPGQSGLAFRMPALNWLREFVRQSGPIIATSANKSGYPSKLNINDIKSELPGLDFYLDGPTGTKPSSIVRLLDDGATEEIKRS